MSGLAGLLAGRTPPGVLRWVNVADIDDLRSAVEHAGFGFAHLDGWLHPDRESLLVEVGASLGFPDYYGQNLDALADCLADVASPHIVVWDGWTVMAEEDPATFGAITDIFAERASVAPHVSLLLRASRDVAGPGDLLD